MNRLWLAIPALFLLSACSTLLDKTTQEVRFETPGAAESTCLVKTGNAQNDGLLYKVNPPETLTLMKTDNELTVDCLANGNREHSIKVQPIVSRNAFLNVGTAFSSLLVDEHTNAMYLYPDVIAVDFANIEPQKPSLPAHAQTSIRPAPDNIDPYKEGLPVLYPSDYVEPEAPRKRQRPMPSPPLTSPQKEGPKRERRSE